MDEFSRRTFLGVSAGAVASLQFPFAAFAQTQCVTGPYPSFLPNQLTVDCASRRNFQVFRKYAKYLGLAGVVSMTYVRGRYGAYQAGNLFLFPWLKPGAPASQVWDSVVPTSATGMVSAAPIPGRTLPTDEYFCHHRLLASPTAAFIGFAVDVPFDALEAKLGLYSNVSKLADGKPVGIDWASSNLNHPWFGGRRQIPATSTCNGAAWRKLIVDGLSQASSAAC